VTNQRKDLGTGLFFVVKKWYNTLNKYINIMKKPKCPPREWKRSDKFDDHHILARSRGGQSIESNLLYMNLRRHQAFHLLFNNLTLDEASELLKRVSNLKKSKAEKFLLNCPILKKHY
jgi:hypothetical protein